MSQETAKRYSSGDFAGVWDLSSRSITSKMSRADYVKISEACQTAGLPITSKPIRLEGNSAAIVRWEIGTLGRTYTLLYEDGHWKVGPTSEFKAELGKPVDSIIATRKAQGSC